MEDSKNRPKLGQGPKDRIKSPSKLFGTTKSLRKSFQERNALGVPTSIRQGIKPIGKEPEPSSQYYNRTEAKNRQHQKSTRPNSNNRLQHLNVEKDSLALKKSLKGLTRAAISANGKYIMLAEQPTSRGEMMICSFDEGFSQTSKRTVSGRRSLNHRRTGSCMSKSRQQKDLQRPQMTTQKSKKTIKKIQLFEPQNSKHDSEETREVRQFTLSEFDMPGNIENQQEAHALKRMKQAQMPVQLKLPKQAQSVRAKQIFRISVHCFNVSASKECFFLAVDIFDAGYSHNDIRSSISPKELAYTALLMAVKLDDTHLTPRMRHQLNGMEDNEYEQDASFIADEDIALIEVKLALKLSYLFGSQPFSFWISLLTKLWDQSCSAHPNGRSSLLFSENGTLRSYLGASLQQHMLSVSIYNFPKHTIILSIMYLILRMHIEQAVQGISIEVARLYLSEQLRKSSNVLFYDCGGINILFGDFLATFEYSLADLISCIKSASRSLSVCHELEDPWCHMHRLGREWVEPKTK